MSQLTRKCVQKCMADSPWSIGNGVLYSLCLQHPRHRKPSEVLAKIWLIGRSYAAAIERRKDKKGINDDFYIDQVAPAICRSAIDTWIRSAARHKSPSTDSLPAILSAHENVTKLFEKISGLEKRSLASKYLHFHLPNLFFIYDSRVEGAMRSFSKIVGRVSTSGMKGDMKYGKFAEKCLRLHSHIANTFGIALTPRQIDTLLLHKSGHMMRLRG